MHFSVTRKARLRNFSWELKYGDFRAVPIQGAFSAFLPCNTSNFTTHWGTGTALLWYALSSWRGLSMLKRAVSAQKNLPCLKPIILSPKRQMQLATETQTEMIFVWTLLRPRRFDVGNSTNVLARCWNALWVWTSKLWSRCLPSIQAH